MITFILGGSAGVGRELCRALAAEGHDLIVVSRDRRDLQAESAHCRLTFGVKIDWIEADASDPAAMGFAIASHISANDLQIQNLVLPVGGAMQEDNTSTRQGDILKIMNANLTSIIVAVNTLLPCMAPAGCRNIIGFGSIAAIRGRRANITYSAAKRGLESYFESLRHSIAESGIHVKLYRLGYVETQQSFGRKLLLPASRPEWIARRVLADWNRDIGIVNLPGFWFAVGVVLRCLPWCVFRNLRY